MTNNKIKCKYKFQDPEKFGGKPYCTLFNLLCEGIDFVCDMNCQVFEDYKELLKLKSENEGLQKQIIDTNGLRVDAARARFKAKKYLTALDKIEELIKGMFDEWGEQRFNFKAAAEAINEARRWQ